jgi:hypothetical protein
LWFKPNDIPPPKRAYPVELSDTHYYLKDDVLYTDYVSGSTCLLAPGDTAWSSDLDALRRISEGRTSPCPLRTVAAKYLINEDE